MLSGPQSDELPASPWPWLVDWLPGNDEPARPVMTVASVLNAGARPAVDARILLLSEFDEDGFYFHTPAGSRKVAQFDRNPSVALVLHQEATLRQLIVHGTVEAAPAGEVARVWRARSGYLRLLTLLSDDAFAALPYAERRLQWQSMVSATEGGSVDLVEQPPSWSGFRVRAHHLSFWQGTGETASRRIEFNATGEMPGPLSATKWQVSVHAG